ncbi:snRNA-activating protein complex subunit 4 [Chanos chanos]|uniref:snRNA-activating protein complex subunit 4 n=1 Tax=Chanos chanos TaxID=29144 RepID=A0A6J2WTW3_CHACN|nr:snRNA-activating protein complex subunit 4 [Chanos chanos]
MASDDLHAEREKIQREILALERTLGADDNIVDLLSTDSSDDEESDGSGTVDDDTNLEEKRKQIQREIEELEQTLGQEAPVTDLSDNDNDTQGQMESSEEDSDDEDIALPQDVDTCLQMNLVYQEVLKEKLTELERLLEENQKQQREIEEQLSGPTTSHSTVSGQSTQKLFLGNFMKPYFKDKVTGLGPPSNEETRERQSNLTRPCDDVLKVRRWEGWQKTLLINSVVADTMKRLLQPKLSKVDYLTAKMSKAEDEEKEVLKQQIDMIEKEISEISSMTEEQLMGSRHDDHDWDKIANIDFEGLRQAEDLKRFWENYLHPSINKLTWKQDEIEKLKVLVEKHDCCNWDQIAEELGTNRTAFMCFQTYQRYISKNFRKRVWTSEEDKVLRNLVENMRIGNFIPYTQISYFMEGRDSAQLMYRWTSVLDPSLKKGPWSREEDELLLKAVEKYGVKHWWKIRLEVPGRTDGQCRDRYLDCLSEDVKKGPWSKEEENLLTRLVQKYGAGKWAKIASEIPNRVDCQCLHKWRSLTKQNNARMQNLKRPYSHTKHSKQQQKPPKKRKVENKKTKTKSKEKGHSSNSEEEMIQYMDSDDGGDLSEKPSSVCNPENKPMEEYILPDMKEWIPQNHNPWNREPGTVRTVMVRRPTMEDEKAYRECRMGSNVPHQNNSPKPVYSTFLDCFGRPVDTYVGIEPPCLTGKRFSTEIPYIKVSPSEIKQLLIWQGIAAEKSINLRRKKHTTSENAQNESQGIADQTGEEMNTGAQMKTRSPKARLAIIGKDSTNFSLKYALMLAIIPWIGNVLVPLPFYQRKRCQADVLRERAKHINLSKTPVFSLFLKALRVDTEGCKKVIDAQARKVPYDDPNQAVVTPTPPPRAMTVAMMLKEKRSGNQRRGETGKETPNQKQPAGQTTATPIMAPQMFVVSQPTGQRMSAGSPGTLVFPQPAGQGISIFTPTLVQSASPSPQPIRPSVLKLPQDVAVSPNTPSSSVSCSSTKASNSVRTETSGTPKRTRKLTEKARALQESAKAKTPKGVKSTQASKQGVSPRVNPTPQPITLILTPAGLVPVSGVQLLISNNPVGQTEKNTNTPQNIVSPIPIVLNQQGALAPKPLANISQEVTNAPNASAAHAAVNSSQHSKSSSDISGGPTATCHTKALPTIAGVNASSTLAGTSVVPANNRIQLPRKTAPALVSSKPIVTVPIQQPLLPSNIWNPPPPQFAVNNPVTPLHLPSPQMAALPRAPQTDQSAEQPGTASARSNPKPAAVTFDPNLMFLEEPALVKDFLNGKGGVALPQLENSLPYLPPFVSNINTLASLLKAKKALVNAAVQLLANRDGTSTTGAGPSTDGENEEAVQVAAIRRLVAERFANNPAYLLLKARFLSCFTLPALLATIQPCKVSATSKNTEDQSEEESGSADETVHSPDVEQQKTVESLLSTDEEMASASHFSGIVTRRKSGHNKKP